MCIYIEVSATLSLLDALFNNTRIFLEDIEIKLLYKHFTDILKTLQIKHIRTLY